MPGGGSQDCRAFKVSCALIVPFMRFRVRTIAKRSFAVPAMFADLDDLVETAYILIPKGEAQGFPKTVCPWSDSVQDGLWISFSERSVFA